jgi:phospholipid/cholesterol/gamma-HCH transport system ATP-binding protein
MIKIEGLWKSFGSTEVLRGLDLEIRDGETIVIIGRSGGGKSVLLKHLCGLLKPDKGKVLVDGTDIVPLGRGGNDADPQAIRISFSGRGAL